MSGVIKLRVERLADERDRTQEKLGDLHALAEEETRPLSEFETEQAAKYRQQIADYDEEIELLATDIERESGSRDVSELLREDEGDERRALRHCRARTARSCTARSRSTPVTSSSVDEKCGTRGSLAGSAATRRLHKMQAEERLERTLQNVTSTTVAGLIIPTHMTDILDIIDRSRPVCASGRAVPLDRGSMTYPKIGTRPDGHTAGLGEDGGGHGRPHRHLRDAHRQHLPGCHERLLAGGELVEPGRARALPRSRR